MRQWQGRELYAFYRHRLFEPGRDLFFDPRNVVIERDEKRRYHRDHKQHRERDQYGFKPFHLCFARSESLIGRATLLLYAPLVAPSVCCHSPLARPARQRIEVVTLVKTVPRGF